MLTFRTKFHQALAILPVCFNQFAMGIGYGWLAPTLKLFQESNVLSLTSDECSWIGSIHDLGRVASPLITAIFLETVGRTKMIAVSTLTFFLMWLFVIFTNSVYVLYAVRLVFGISVGISDITVPIYYGENLSPELRGIFGSIALSFYYAGVMLEYVLATYLPYTTVAITNAAIAFVALLSIFYLKEPAQFLILKEKYDQAEKNFNWLSNANANDAKTEYEKVKQLILEEKNKKLTLRTILSNPFYLKITAIIFVLSMLVVSTGIAGLNTFVSIALSSTDILSANELTILYGLCQFIAVFMSSFIIEQFDRRTIFIYSLVLAGIVHSCSAALYYVQQNITDVPHFSWLIFATISSYAAIYSMGILPIYFTIRGELFPQNLKSIGGCLAIVGNSAMGFLTTKMFLFLLNRFGIYVNFLFFTAVCMFTAIFVYLLLPETRGKTLQEIQKLLTK